MFIVRFPVIIVVYVATSLVMIKMNKYVQWQGVAGRLLQQLVKTGTFAEFWLGGSMPPCRLRREKF